MDYKKLFQDKTDGKIPNDMIIVFDNDCGWWRYSGDENLTDEQLDEKVESCEKKYGRPNGYDDVVDIMVAAGFNAEWC